LLVYIFFWSLALLFSRKSSSSTQTSRTTPC
jgi:hypothetical protein